MRYKKYQKRDLLAAFNLPKPTEAVLERIEKVFGALPDDYQIFLKTHNGGTPSSQIFYLNERSFVVNEFLAAAGGTCIYDSVENYLTVYMTRTPKGMIPIARSPGGDLFLMGLEKKNSGQIFYCFHDREGGGDGSNFLESATLLSETFTEFMNGLVD